MKKDDWILIKDSDEVYKSKDLKRLKKLCESRNKKDNEKHEATSSRTTKDGVVA